MTDAPPNTLRFLAIDPGDKRTGLASGDTQTRFVGPVGVLELPMKAGTRGEPLVAAIVKAAREHEVDALVLGLPLNMDDSEGPRAKLVRAFGERLAKATGIEIRYQDERLTSVDADWAMARSGLTHKGKKKRRDALAACAILRDHLATIPTN